MELPFLSPPPKPMCRRWWWESTRKGRRKPLTTHQRGELEHFCRSAGGPVWGKVRRGFTKSSPGEGQSRQHPGEKGRSWRGHLGSPLSFPGRSLTFSKEALGVRVWGFEPVSWISQEVRAVGCWSSVRKLAPGWGVVGVGGWEGSPWGAQATGAERRGLLCRGHRLSLKLS